MYVVSSTDGITHGNCGDITLWVFNLGHGDAELYEAVSSSQGGIITLSYNAVWLNHRTNGSNSFGNSYLFPSNPWVNRDYPYTQTGFVTASMKAWDHVGAPWPFGKDCVGYENDSVIVT